MKYKQKLSKRFMKKLMAFVLCIGLLLSENGNITVRAESDETDMTVIEVSTEKELSAALIQVKPSSRVKIKLMNDLDIGYQYISRGEIVLDLNGHTLTQVLKSGGTSAQLYISAYGGDVDFTLENGTLYTKDIEYSINIDGADGTLSRVTLNHMTMINKTPKSDAFGRCRNINIANANNRVTIKNSYLYSEQGYNLYAFGGYRKEQDNAIRIENTSMLAYNYPLGLYAKKGITAEEIRPVYLSESSLQSFSTTDAIYTDGKVGIVIPDGQEMYRNGIEQSIQNDIVQEVPTGMLIQTGKPENFHTLTMQAVAECNCQLRGTGTGTENKAIVMGKFAEDRTIALSTSTDKNYEFLGYRANVSDESFYNEQGMKEANAKSGFFKMPSQDVVVEAGYELPYTISSFKYKMLTVPTLDNSSKEVRQGIALADETESRHSILRKRILDNDNFIKKDYNNINDIFEITDSSTDDFTFEYGKTYYIFIASRYNPDIYELMDGYSGTLNGDRMIYLGSASNDEKTVNSQIYYLPIKANWCGKTLQDEVTWRYDEEEKCLIIEGEGILQTYAAEEFPWKDYSAKIEKLKIGKNITNTEYLINKMSAFTTVDVEEENPELAVVDGVVYAKKDGKLNRLIYIPSGVTSFTIPDLVTTISANAGKDAVNVKKITLGYNISSIEEKAFSGCSALETILIRNKKCAIQDSPDTIPAATVIEAIKNSTAYQYAKKYSRTFAAPKEIGEGPSDSVQWSYDAETKTLTILGIGSMQNFVSDTAPWKEEDTISDECKKVVIEDGVMSIGDYAFSDMSQLEQVEFGSGLRTIGKYAFGGTNLSQVILPEGLTKIGDMAFSSKSIKYINISSSVNSIGKLAFFDEMCGKLERIDVADDNNYYMVKNNILYTKDGSIALLYASGSTEKSIEIEKGTTCISQFLFAGARNLKQIEIPEGVKEIQSAAFMGSGITQISIPRSVEYMGEHVFGIANDLLSVILLNPEMTVESDSFSGMNSNVTVYVHEGTLLYFALSTYGVNVNNIHYYETIIDRVATTQEEGIKHEECWFCHNKKEAVTIPKLSVGSDEKTKQEVIGSTNIGTRVPTVKIQSVKNKKKNKLAVKWKKAKNITYYEIQYSLNKQFKGKKKYKTKLIKTKKTSLTIKRLKKNKNYYVRIRGVNRQGVKGAWNKAQKVKIKK